MSWLRPEVDPYADGFWVRLGRLLYWSGAGIAAICGIGAAFGLWVVLFSPVDDHAAMGANIIAVSVVVGAACYLAGRAMRYLLAGE